MVSLNNILKANKTLEGDPITLAKRFIAQLGAAIESVGTENQTAVQKSLAHLVQNDAALQNVIVKGLQISAAKGGGAITLKELGMTDEQIAQFALSTINTNDPKLLMATKELIPNYDELIRQPEPLAPAPTPHQVERAEQKKESKERLKANETVKRATDEFKEVDDKNAGYNWKIRRYDTKDIIGRNITIKEQPGIFEVVKKEGNQYVVKQNGKNYLVPINRIDTKSFVYNIGDTVIISLTSDNRKHHDNEFEIVQKGGEYEGNKLKADEYLLRPAQSNRRYQSNELLIVNMNAIKGKVNAP